MTFASGRPAKYQGIDRGEPLAGHALRLGLGEQLLLVGVATGLATALGGLVALRLRVPNLLIAFAAGAVIGVALFDLLAEALSIEQGSRGAFDIVTCFASGFAVYFTVDRVGATCNSGWSGHRAHLGPIGLTLHSLMDGLGIGIAFKLSASVGAIVAAAVLTHDFLDGLNTVTLSMAGGRGRRVAGLWLLADAFAPLFGIGLSYFLVLQPDALARLLSLFAGSFLYIGTCELLPRSHELKPTRWTIMATLSGLGLIYGVVRLTALSGHGA